jgi:hypothetical protein
MIKRLIAKLRKPKTSPPPSPQETGFCWFRIDCARDAASLIIVVDRLDREVSRYLVYVN